MAKPNTEISEREAEQRRDDVLRAMLSTPPKPQSETKFGKPRGKTGKSPNQRKRGKS
jgi:hypothetical protein